MGIQKRMFANAPPPLIVHHSILLWPGHATCNSRLQRRSRVRSECFLHSARSSNSGLWATFNAARLNPNGELRNDDASPCNLQPATRNSSKWPTRLYFRSIHNATCFFSHSRKYFCHGCFSRKPSNRLIFALDNGASNSSISRVIGICGYNLFRKSAVRP